MERVWITLCDSKSAHYNESRMTHCRQTLLHSLRIQILSSNWSYVACTVKIEIVTRSNSRSWQEAYGSVCLSPCLSLSLLPSSESWAPREFAKFPTQLQLQLCGSKRGRDYRSRRVHLREAQSSRKLQSKIFCRRRRRCRRRPTHDVPADTGARRAEWDGAHAVQLQLGQRAIVLCQVVQGRPRILSLYAQRRAHGANVPGGWRKRKRECEFARTGDA